MKFFEPGGQAALRNTSARLNLPEYSGFSSITAPNFPGSSGRGHATQQVIADQRPVES